MDSIQEPLNQTNPQTADGQLSNPDQNECDTCGKPSGRYSRCNDCINLERAEQEKTSLVRARQKLAHEWWETSGIPSRYRAASFQGFKRELQPEAYDVAWRYLMEGISFIDEDEAWPNGKARLTSEHRAPSLFLASAGNGTGKTHLAAAIGRGFMRIVLDTWEYESRRCPILFTTIPRMLLRIRASYQDNAQESEQDIIDDLSTVPLLILDDVGKEKPSDHTRQTYFLLIDSRYGAELPMLVTSNFTLPKHLKELNNILGEASMSRLKEMTEGWRVTMNGEDYRFREKG